MRPINFWINPIYIENKIKFANMRVSNIALLLAIAIGVYCGTAAYYGGWIQDYESIEGTEKFEYLWGKITEDANPSSFPSVLGLMKLAAPEMLGGLNFWVSGEHVSDQFPAGRFKGIHSVGKVAKCKFNWDVAKVKELGLTGAFTEQNEKCIVRVSSGANPTMKKVPNLAIKVLRSGTPSGNIFAGHGLKGTQDPNFFVNPLANHVPNRHGSLSKDGAEAALFNLVFTKGPEMHGITGLSEFGQYTSDGKAAPFIKVPFTLVFEQYPSTKEFCEGKQLEGQNFGCFKDMEENMILYNLFAIMNPILAKDLTADDVIPIGTFQSTSKFVNSKFGDEQLFYKHTYWPQEMELLKGTPAGPAWNAIVDEKFMDTEGPEAYRKFFLSNRNRVVRRKFYKLKAHIRL